MPDEPSFPFTPVPPAGRRDDWPPELQFRFIAALARGVPLVGAARSVGKCRTAAYALRSRPGAESFTAAWVAALNHAKEKRSARARSG
ncbi:MAG TPA: hypothetical protein VGB04_14335 [Allosphingosinicella sp.]